MNGTAERIAFVLPNLSGGGAARVASVVTAAWAKAGHEVHLVTFEKPGTESVYPLHAQLHRHQIGAERSPPNPLGMVTNNLSRVRRLRKVFGKIAPTIIISFLLDANVPTVLAGRGRRVPLLISERNHPAHDAISAIKARIRAHVYPQAGRLCVQTQDIADWYQRTLGLASSIIPNPAAAQPVKTGVSAVPRTDGMKRVLALGRLEPQKGYDRLIDAFAELGAGADGWEMVIFGEGALRGALEAQVQRRGLVGRVHMPGTTKSPGDEFANADLFVHASRFEGYPNAVIEALAAGLCVVVTDAPGAAGELMQGGRHGVLVADAGPHELAQGMARVMGDEVARRTYAASAPAAIASLAADRIAEQWIETARALRKPV